MNKPPAVVSGQLRLGDADLTAFTEENILQKIEAAHKFAGMTRLLFLPSRVPKVNRAVHDFCRDQGIELYLWYKILTDNDIIAQKDELLLDAWGGRGRGESGVWSPIFEGEESYHFSCPNNEKYTTLLLNRCAQALSDYDGLFLDCIGYPLPSLGLEALFTCFCRSCEGMNPHVAEWRVRIRELRDCLESASDADLGKWGTFGGVIEAFGLWELYHFRRDSVTALAGRFSSMAREQGKAVGIDVLSPALGMMGGHDYLALGRLGDWLKPRIYLRTYGPSSIPLEYCCMALGMKSWGKGFGLGALLEFIGRSTRIPLPGNVHHLRECFLSPSTAAAEFGAFRRLTSAPAHVSVECSRHPEYETLLEPDVIREYLGCVREAEGLVLAWNLLFVPEDYMRLVGEVSCR